ncbi:heavy-metal-associated domain-containing protein [Williamwhitmania taraxaci]|uniref:Copper chaperone CopZ n=1 Tax=Williamwhitmania taraxaci TaxID=1640674 RepID=A0A1G6GV22_9BACT|nr:heavy metal-associated domain-containing protein [Williamwhitmania taraxaci]SDB85545.1 Copper chaperone CopZ [Williamwhitmania taraxaci]
MRFLLVFVFSAIALISFGNPDPTAKTDCVYYSVKVDSKDVKANVEKKMLALQGVTAVEVSVVDSYIQVTYSPSKVTAVIIKEKIEKLGLAPQPLKCKPQSSYCDGDCRGCSAIKSRGRH